ncbi:Metallo-dependent phosphatase-like protein [Chytriomyces sp. MP71]|nr:Metallo-dependent phosphatase-like protein [Chytriomyces sp. MP71]
MSSCLRRLFEKRCRDRKGTEWSAFFLLEWMLGSDAGMESEASFKILIVESSNGEGCDRAVATDNHLGYLEKDPIRKNDSFAAFHEILMLAKTEQVDFLLLGGDLFHDNKPSRKCLHKTITMLRQFCMGDTPCLFDFVSAQDEAFKDTFATVNYADPNYNVAIPVFSIHGNHDDPSGDGDLCALDILSAAGLVNYFGRADMVDDIQITPMLLKKGHVKLAVYGMGNIRDERLYRTFTSKKVKMFRPKEDKDEWFNLFVLHQNRVKRGPTNYIPESFLPDFLHLVVWGHEHDCLIDLEQNDEKGFYITQPGSSVATSLSEGEMIPKHVGILEIHPDKQFKLEKVALKSVRPFVMDDIVLADCAGLRRADDKSVDAVLADKVEKMIETARNVWLEAHPGASEDEFPKPLIRLRVDYSNFTTLNPSRFGQRFVDRVANVKEILYFFRKRAATAAADKKASAGNNKTGFDMPTSLPDKLDKFQVQDLVEEFLAAQNLEILPENGIGEAVRLFVEKEDKEAISEFVNESLKRTQDNLGKVPSDVIFDEPNLMKQCAQRKDQARGVDEDEDDKEGVPVSGEEEDVAPKRTTARGKAATAARKRAKSNKRKKVASSDEENEVVEEVGEEETRLQERQRRGLGAPAAVKVAEQEEEVVVQTSDAERDVVMDSPPAPSRGTATGSRAPPPPVPAVSARASRSSNAASTSRAK